MEEVENGDNALATPRRTTYLAEIYRSMATYPEMVGGGDRFCTLLMEIFKGALIAKLGADGCYGIGLRASPATMTLGAEGAIRISVKVEDGSIRNRLCSGHGDPGAAEHWHTEATSETRSFPSCGAEEYDGCRDGVCFLRFQVEDYVSKTGLMDIVPSHRRTHERYLRNIRSMTSQPEISDHLLPIARFFAFFAVVDNHQGCADKAELRKFRDRETALLVSYDETEPELDFYR